MALQLYRNESSGVIYADPAEPDYTVRFKFSSSPKSLNGVAAVNHVSEIICTDNNDVTIAGVNAVDAVSVRVRISGAHESKARKVQIVNALVGQLLTWANDEGVLAGFPPTTVPATPSTPI